jgi:DNA polymerase (family 10)
MPLHNADIAVMFDRLADLLEIENANPFRVRAYRNAARTVGGLARSVESMLAEGADLTELPGIGKDLAGKIQEIVTTGHLALLDEVEKRTPRALAEMLSLPGLGPKRVQSLHEQLAIDTLAELRQAAAHGRVSRLRGFSKALEEKILHEIDRRAQTGRRTRISVAEEIAAPLVAYLKNVPGVREVEVAGSFRRRRETVGDLDILVTCRPHIGVMDRFVAYEDVTEVVAKGETRSTVLLRSGLQVDLRVVPEVSYGAALVYFTGSKAHNIAIRTMAVRKGLKINEYGVFDGDRRVAGRTEAGVYAKIGLPVVPPELREDRGEIEAALAHRLPDLVTLTDIRGDLHTHTNASDGRASIREMAEAARDAGYGYIAVTDHTQHATIAHGLDAKRLRRQIAEIDRLGSQVRGVAVLKSAEVDILADGKLDLADEVLDDLDFTVCAVHSHFNLPRAKQTERILRAMDNARFTVLAHPTGRLLGAREPYEIDMERIIEGARERGCILEINAQPERLDLNDVHCRMARDAGVKVAISTDAHSPEQLGYMRFGIDQARRGWLTAGDVVNTRPLRELRGLLRR